jgi:cytochrome c oxidase subunit 1
MAARRAWIASHTPMLWVIGGVVTLAMGASTRTLVTNALTHSALHDTYFVVDHSKYVIRLAMVFVFFAAWYYLFPKLTGYAYSDLLSRIHFWLFAIGLIVILVPPQILLAVRTVEQLPDVADLLRDWILISRIGSYLCAAGTLVFVANMVLSFLRKRPAPP